MRIPEPPPILDETEYLEGIACVCGNTSDDYGFYPVNLFENITRLESDNEARVFVCPSCWRLFNVTSFAVVGVGRLAITLDATFNEKRVTLRF